MNYQKSIGDYFTSIQALVNSIKACGEKFPDQQIVDKVLIRLSPQFDHIVMAMEESKDLEKMRVEELQDSFEPHEQRLLQRSSEKVVVHALHAQTSRKNDGGGNKSERGKLNESKDFGEGPSKVSNQNYGGDN
uniref:Retrovirus-related Pol polyprotein from transposon TNT 1-94 n=1 Tax=Cajanus cajan TaxID=3821 RepID=A0A151TLI4_CAJCA|nr:hypothetical protein KK1_021510 [Cajanus cajan]